MRILIVEDDVAIARALRMELEDAGFVADHAASGRDGAAMALANSYAAILLDVRLPDVDGFQVCRELREEGVETPVLMLTALGETGEKVEGLDSGADDYLVKPYELDELLARLRSILRRTPGPARRATLSMCDLTLDPATREVRRAGKSIPLSRTEYALLEYLMRNPGKTVSREEILSQVWGIDHDPRTNVVNVYIRLLRRKIDDGNQKLIHTIRGFGYQLSEALAR
jgi:DNA-binding response OmpR family regulator